MFNCHAGALGAGCILLFDSLLLHACVSGLARLLILPLCVPVVHCRAVEGNA